MSDVWRRKTYYDKRVLIETTRVLDPQFDDELLCITGGQLEMLRNLMRHLHRRSTFVSEYHNQYYLAPTTAEWDSLQAVVADLEETLMGCTELTAAVNAMAAQLACICQAMGSWNCQTQPQDAGYDGQAQYDDYISDVEEDVGDPPTHPDTWAEWRVMKCKGAQKLIDDIAQSTQELGASLVSGILITFTLLNGLLLLTIITAPISMVLQLVITFAAIGANYLYEDVVVWLLEHKQNLVCEIYKSDTTGEAIQRVTAYINDRWDVSSPSNPTLQFFCRAAMSTIFDGAMRDYNVWEGDYSEEYCVACEDLPEGLEFTWEWPPCPGDHFLDGGICENGRLCFNGDTAHAHQQHIVTQSSINNIEVECRFRSDRGPGNTVGAWAIDVWDTILDDWRQLAMLSTHTDQAAGNLNTVIDDAPVGPPEGAGLYRARLLGAAGQHESSPYPLQVEYARVKYEDL